MSDLVKRYIVRAHGFNFGPFRDPQEAHDWAVERHSRLRETDKFDTVPCEFSIAELREPREWGAA